MEVRIHSRISPSSSNSDLGHRDDILYLSITCYAKVPGNVRQVNTLPNHENYNFAEVEFYCKILKKIKNSNIKPLLKYSCTFLNRESSWRLFKLPSFHEDSIDSTVIWTWILFHYLPVLLLLIHYDSIYATLHPYNNFYKNFLVEQWSLGNIWLKTRIQNGRRCILITTNWGIWSRH